MSASVLDSWAMIGWLQGEEPARAQVRELLEQASRGETKVSISLLNVGEVFYLTLQTRAHRAPLGGQKASPVMPAAGASCRYPKDFCQGGLRSRSSHLFASASPMNRSFAGSHCSVRRYQ